MSGRTAWTAAALLLLLLPGPVLVTAASADEAHATDGTAVTWLQDRLTAAVDRAGVEAPTMDELVVEHRTLRGPGGPWATERLSGPAAASALDATFNAVGEGPWPASSSADGPDRVLGHLAGHAMISDGCDGYDVTGLADGRLLVKGAGWDGMHWGESTLTIGTQHTVLGVPPGPAHGTPFTATDTSLTAVGDLRVEEYRYLVDGSCIATLGFLSGAGTFVFDGPHQAPGPAGGIA